MNIEPLRYTHEQLINLARISNADIKRINQCRRPHNRLGFAYQLSFIRLANRFPSQDSFEVVDEILSYVSVQIGIPSKAINTYAQRRLRRQTVDEHRGRIREYLGLNRFGEADGVFCRFHHGIFHPHSCGFYGCLIRPADGDMGVHPQVFGKPQVFPKLLGLLL